MAKEKEQKLEALKQLQDNTDNINTEVVGETKQQSTMTDLYKKIDKSDFESTISTFEIVDLKNGHSLYISCKISSFLSSLLIHFVNAVPTPYHPGSIILACDQENTHGIALKLSSDCVFLREDGLEPIFNPAMKFIGVTSKKKSENPSVL